MYTFFRNQKNNRLNTSFKHYVYFSFTMACEKPKPEEKFLLKNGRVLLKEMFDGLAYSYPEFDVYPESRIVGLKTLVSIIRC